MSLPYFTMAAASAAATPAIASSIALNIFVVVSFYAASFYLQNVNIFAAAGIKVGIPPAFPHQWLIVVSLPYELPSRPSPLSLPLHPSWPPLLPHRCHPINLHHRLFNSLPLLMPRHADCRPLLAASTAASNASYPPLQNRGEYNK